MDMNKKLSIIMPFLNEGQEPLNTIRSIYDTANPDDFEIIAIQDDPKDFEFDASEFKSVRLYRNQKRIGAHPSQNVGAALAQSPNMIFIDAHMRFKKSDWLQGIVDNLDHDPKTLFCTTCVGLGHTTTMDVEISTAKYRGASLLLTNDYTAGEYTCKDGEKRAARQVLEGKWCTDYNPDRASPYEIPCVMGANYCIKKDWFEYLHGFNFLLFWGSSEPYLSLKSWLAGGNIKFIPEIEIGHIFRDRSPFATPIWHLIFNKLLMTRLFFPKEMGDLLETYIPNDPAKTEASKTYIANLRTLTKEREYLMGIFTRNMRDYCDHFGLYFPSEPMRQ